MPAPNGPQWDKHQVMRDFAPHLEEAGLTWSEFAGKLHKVSSLQHLTRNQRLAKADQLRTNNPEMFQKMLTSFSERDL